MFIISKNLIYLHNNLDNGKVIQWMSAMENSKNAAQGQKLTRKQNVKTKKIKI